MSTSVSGPLDVVSVGIFCVDLLAKPVRRLPPPGGLEMIDDYDLQTGGCANNAAIAMARLGLKVATVGRVGDDRMGDIVLQVLEANGVLTDYMVRDGHCRTALSVVAINEKGERSFIHHPGATLALAADDVPSSLLGRTRSLHIGGAFLLPRFDGHPMARLLRQARENGAVTFVDTAVDGKGNPLDVVRAVLPHVDYFLPSEAEASGMTGTDDPQKMAACLLRQGVGTVCIKLGERGCYVADAGGGELIPAYDVDPVDTCGAGDTFTAGFIAGVLNGWDATRAASLANAVGAMCVLSLGATAGVQGMRETLAFMNSTPQRCGA